VFAQVVAGFPEPTEVDDSFDTGLFRGPGEIRGQLIVDVGLGVGAPHRVNQVVGDVVPDEQFHQAPFVAEVRLGDGEIRVFGPASGPKLHRGSSQAPHVVSRVEQSWGESAPDVPRCSGENHTLCRVCSHGWKGHGGMSPFVSGRFMRWRGTSGSGSLGR